VPNDRSPVEIRFFHFNNKKRRCRVWKINSNNVLLVLWSGFSPGDLGPSFTRSVFAQRRNEFSPVDRSQFFLSFLALFLVFLWFSLELQDSGTHIPRKSLQCWPLSKQQQRPKLQSLLTLPSPSTPALRCSPSRSHQNGRSRLLSLALGVAYGACEEIREIRRPCAQQGAHYAAPQCHAHAPPKALAPKKRRQSGGGGPLAPLNARVCRRDCWCCSRVLMLLV